MHIGAIQKSSFVDFPGRISAIVFTQGCNLRCPYCHNPELVDPRRFIPAIPQEDIFAFLNKRKGLLDGIVITGGEPCLQPDLIEFITNVKEMGYQVKLDSNGTRPDVLDKIITQELVDYIAMDIKAPAARYGAVTGVQIDTAAIGRSIELIMDSGPSYEFRTTLAHGLLMPEDIIKIGTQIRGAKRYALQNFVASKHVDETFLSAQPFSPDEMQSIQKPLENLVDELIIR